jgi:hypothetical protein
MSLSSIAEQRLAAYCRAMKVLPASSLDVVVGWLAHLPCPWCPATAALSGAPDLPALRPVLNYLGQRRVDAPLQDAA